MAGAVSRVSIFAAALLFVLSPPLAAQNVAYTAHPGDQIDLKFYTASGAEVREISGSRWVDQNGQIYLPYIGQASVAGLDADGIRAQLANQFQAFYDGPVIEVAVKLHVNVTGTVRTPGHYYVEPTSTLVDALAIAGGSGGEIDFASQGGAADPSKVQLVRDGALEILDLRAEAITPEVFSRIVRSGDWLHVPPPGPLALARQPPVPRLGPHDRCDRDLHLRSASQQLVSRARRVASKVPGRVRPGLATIAIPLTPSGTESSFLPLNERAPGGPSVWTLRSINPA